MMRNERKDIILCRQILGERPYELKKYSSEGKKRLGNIVKSLNTQEGFVVTVKAVQDHLFTYRQARETEKTEDKASGIEVKEKEINNLIDNISDDMKACEEELAEETTKASNDKEKEKKAAEDVRKSAMETFSESRKRCAL